MAGDNIPPAGKSGEAHALGRVTESTRLTPGGVANTFGMKYPSHICWPLNATLRSLDSKPKYIFKIKKKVEQILLRGNW